MISPSNLKKMQLCSTLYGTVLFPQKKKYIQFISILYKHDEPDTEEVLSGIGFL